MEGLADFFAGSDYISALSVQTVDIHIQKRYIYTMKPIETIKDRRILRILQDRQHMSRNQDETFWPRYSSHMSLLQASQFVEVIELFLVLLKF